VELVGRRQDVALVVAEFGYSERRACKLMGIDRTSYRYQPRPDHNMALRQELLILAGQRPRYGYRRLTVLLERPWVQRQRRARVSNLSRGTPGRATTETQAAATTGTGVS
jgi:putative transposase